MIGFSDSFAQFILNYRMKNVESFIPELINMLKEVEPSLKKEGKAVVLVEPSNTKKKNFTKTKGGMAKNKVKEKA